MTTLLSFLWAMSLSIQPIQTLKWEGNWSFKDNQSRYFTLKVSPKTDATYPCTLEVEGNGFVYVLNCDAIEKSGELQVHYLSAASGKSAEIFQLHQLLFTLKPVNHKLLTSWSYWNTAKNAEDFKRSQ
jgi:hypothetical protein